MVKHNKPESAFYGGSFDPPHLGHRRIVQAVMHRLAPERIVIEPTWLNPFKTKGYAEPQQRLQWVRRIFANYPCVDIDTYEIAQQRSVSTFETIRHLLCRYDIRYIVIGSDNLPTLTQWHRFAWLNDRFTWVVATRRGFDADTAALRRAVVLNVDVPVSSTSIRAGEGLEYLDKKLRSEIVPYYHQNGIV